MCLENESCIDQDDNLTRDTHMYNNTSELGNTQVMTEQLESDKQHANTGDIWCSQKQPGVNETNRRIIEEYQNNNYISREDISCRQPKTSQVFNISIRGVRSNLIRLTQHIVLVTMK